MGNQDEMQRSEEDKEEDKVEPCERSHAPIAMQIPSWSGGASAVGRHLNGVVGGEVVVLQVAERHLTPSTTHIAFRRGQVPRKQTIPLHLKAK